MDMNDAATKTAALSSSNPCAWDIALSYDGAVLAGVSVRRTDGLPFEHYECEVADHVRATLAARGIDAGRQAATFTRGRTVCVILDA